MPQSESIAKLADALAKAQAIMKPAKKDAENPFFKSHYADLASVWEAVREPLTKHGLSVVQIPTAGYHGVREGGTIYLTTMLMHSSGEWVSGDLSMKPTKDDPQSIGSCLTYARRYALAAITGVASEEDDDGQAASAPAPQKAVQATETPLFKPVIAEQPGHEDGFIWRLNGKKKGQRLEDIEKGYLEWYATNGNVQDHRAAAIMELDRRNHQEIFANQEDELIEE